MATVVSSLCAPSNFGGVQSDGVAFPGPAVRSQCGEALLSDNVGVSAVTNFCTSPAEPSAPAAMADAKTSTAASASGATSIYLKKQNAQLLASGYSMRKRCVESVSIVLFVLVLPIVLFRGLRMLTWDALPTVVLASLFGMASADFVSGLVHWGCDTWGTIHTPLFSAFIRAFREHHVDPMAITRHDMIEANGDNCMLVVPPLIALAAVPPELSSWRDLFVFAYLVSMGIMVALTNQIHKWAHQLRPHWAVRMLQNGGVVLSRRVHNIHHQSPYDRYYCITTGWLNPLLERIDFWGSLEAVVQALSHSTPRADDAIWTQTVRAPAVSARH